MNRAGRRDKPDGQRQAVKSRKWCVRLAQSGLQPLSFFATHMGFDGEPNSLYNHAFSRTVCGKMNSE
jgi:hypothetical protein